MKALVVGGSNGIGLAITKNLITSGYFVEILDRHGPESGILPEGTYSYQYCDLLDLNEDLIQSFVDNPMISFLMITAGYGRVADFEYFHTAEIKNMMTVNATATIQIIRKFYERIMGDEPFYCGVMGSISGFITSFSNGQVLMRDYSPEEAKLILKEMNDDLAMRLRAHCKTTKRLGVAVRYTFSEGGGFSHQVTLDYPTDDTDKIYEDLLKIYEKYVGNHKIRGVYITYSQLESAEYEQLNLFEVGKTDKSKKQMTKTIDDLKRKYGKDTILRASALLEESTAKERHNQIGGHHR